MISDQIRFICSVSLIVISAFGIPINILPCFILLRKKSRNIFHNLLLILNISDTVCIYFQNISFLILSKLLKNPLTIIFPQFQFVLIGCFWIFQLNDVWPSYQSNMFLKIAPWGIPLVQVIKTRTTSYLFSSALKIDLLSLFTQINFL